MEIKTTNTAILNSVTIHKLEDLLLKLETAFKAVVTHKISHQLFSVNTKVGTLHISTDLPIQLGDKLTLKVNTGDALQLKNLQVLKIDRPITHHTTPALSTNKGNETVPTLLLSNQTLLKNIPQVQQHFLAKVINQDKTSVHLQSLKGELFSINKEHFKNTAFNIQKGEYLAIKWTPDHKIEIQQINKEQLLHQAQRQLLPKQKPLLETHQRLNQAAFKLFESINNEIKNLTQHTKPNSDIKNKQTLTLAKGQTSEPGKTSNVTSRQENKPLPSFNNKNSSDISIKVSNEPSILKDASILKDIPTLKPSPVLKDTPILKDALALKDISTLKDNPLSENNKRIPVNENTLLSFKNIKQELNILLTSHRINFKYLDSDTIQKLLNSLNTLSQAKNPLSDHQSFTQKLSVVNQSIETLFNDIETHTAKVKNVSLEEHSFLEALKTSLKEAQQSFESTLHKILFQNTSSKLNQEINNTLLLNTQIPFEVEKQTKDINLKIKQHKNDSDEQEDAWEIHLSLEMGLLGLMSTKIFLKNQFDVSIQFWAERVDTKNLIEDKKMIFQQQMTNAGFILKDINVYLGKKVEEAMPINITNKKFIDINV